MPPFLEQSAANSTAKGAGTTCTATFSTPTRPGSLIVVVAVYTGDVPTNLPDPAGGYTWIGNRSAKNNFGGGIQMSAWYRQDAPATSQVTVVSPSNRRSIQLRALEYSGMAQSNALDKFVGNSSDWLPIFDTGSTSTTAQADELVLAFVGNEHSSTQQFGFGGGLTQLYNTTSPQSNEDWERSRLTVHQSIVTSTGTFRHTGFLSTIRRWCAMVITFRGGSSGPARFTSRNAPPILDTGGTASLTVFGKFTSTVVTNALTTGSSQARIGPYNYQYRLGGWDGLLIGDDTPYRVESHDGLEGWQIRTSDDDLPRGDGALRGVDLQAARQVMVKLKVGGTQLEVEQAMDTLYRALVPQRDADWELIWRHPGRPLRMLRCRPVDLLRGLSWRETLINNQSFVLRATDPRHYSAFVRNVTIPVATDRSTAVPVTVINAGNGPAYPTIRIDGPTSGPPVTRVELVNNSADISFVVEAVLPAGSTLVGDMEARAVGSNRSVITIDEQSKYGAWQHPRSTWRLGPGGNDLFVLTQPPGAPVKATLEFRDTWSG